MPPFYAPPITAVTVPVGTPVAVAVPVGGGAVAVGVSVALTVPVGIPVCVGVAVGVSATSQGNVELPVRRAKFWRRTSHAGRGSTSQCCALQNALQRPNAAPDRSAQALACGSGWPAYVRAGQAKQLALNKVNITQLPLPFMVRFLAIAV